jgi:hypothetical protein
VITQQGDFEIYYHIQDGLSKDGTVEALKKWKARFELDAKFENCAPVHFSFSSEKDVTMYDAIQKGMNYLQKQVAGNEGKILMTWINSDDLLLPGSVQTAFRMIYETGVAEVMTGYPCCIAEDGTYVMTQAVAAVSREHLRKGYYDGRLMPFIMQEGTFWTKKIWDEVGGVRTDLKLCGDWDLWRRFAEVSEILVFRGALACHRRHEKQLSADCREYWKEIDTLLEPVKKKKLKGAWGYSAWFSLDENRCKLEKCRVVNMKSKPLKVGGLRKLERAIRGYRKRIWNKSGD